MIATLTRSLRTTTAGLPRAFWFLWLGTLINRTGGLVQPFLALFLTNEQGLSAGEAGLIVSLFGAGSFFSSLVGGTLTDRVGRRATMLLSSTGSAAMMITFGLVNSTTAMIALTPLLGFALDLYRPAVSALIADLTPPHDRTRAFGLIYWAINLGAALAPVLAGFMASYDYRLLFFGDGLTTLIFAVVIWRAIPETRPAEAAQDRTPWWRSLRTPLHDRLFMGLMLLGLLIALIFFQGWVTLPLHMDSEGFGESDYGAVIALNGAVIVLLGLPASRILPTLPRIPSLAASAVLVGIGFGLVAWASTVPLLMLTVVIWTLGELLTAPVWNALIADLAPIDKRGVYMGFSGMAWGVAYFLAPALGGVILGQLGPAWLWGGAFVLGLIIALSYFALRQPLDARLAAVKADQAA